MFNSNCRQCIGLNLTIAEFSDFSEAVAWIEDPELLSFLNSRVTLTCGSFGIPDPNITWYKDDELLPGEGSSTLVIQEIGLRDRGNYHCRATNFDPSVAMSEMDNIFEQNTEKIFVKIAGVREREREREREEDYLKIILYRSCTVPFGGNE